MDNYFIIKKASTHAGANAGVVTADGELVTRETIIDPSVRYITPWDDVDGPFGDFLSPIANPMVVSDRAAALIRGFVLPPDTAFETVQVHTEVGGEQLGLATMILFRQTFELMDPEDAAAYERLSFSDRYDGVGAPPNILHESTKGFDLLRGLRVLNICSTRLRAAIEDAKLTNCRFLPVAVK